MRRRFTSILVGFVLALAGAGLKAQAPGATPDLNPTGDAGALKAQIQTGGSYNAHSGNATRIVNDLRVPGAVGVYGLDFTRYWNSTHNDYDNYHGANAVLDWPLDFGPSGWSHSWRWNAAEDDIYPEEVRGTDHDTNQYTTAINITFPDGHITKYKIVRLGHGEWMVPGSYPNYFGPPYAQEEIQYEFPYGGTGVHDHLCNMAPDGSEFWLCRADGGSVHFVDMVATEVFDPHGFRTALSYDADGYLEWVEPDGGRFLKINWAPYGGVRFIKSVQSGPGLRGSAVNQTVRYEYGFNYALAEVHYEQEPLPGGGFVKAEYTYGSCWDEGTEPCSPPPNGTGSSLPLLKRADDPHFAGPMTIIRYAYDGVGCPHLLLHPEFHPMYIEAQPYAIVAEKSDTGAVVSSFELHCDGGLRKEHNGIGSSRTFYFGSSAETNNGSLFNRGFELGKLTDFARTYWVQPPYESQNFDVGGHPAQIWDARGIMTRAIYAGGDDSGEPSEIRRVDGSVDYYNRVSPNSATAAIDPAQGMHNSYNHWVFSETHQINATTSHTTTYTRDSRRRVTQINYPDGSGESFVYNNFNQVTSHSLPSGATITRTYDARGLLLQESNDVDPADYTSYTYYTLNNPEGHPEWADLVETMTNGRARAAGTFATKMEYNGRQQVLSVEYPNAPQTPCPTPPPPTPTATATATATPPLPVADPVISPDGGSYPNTPPTTVTIATATSGANIRYTLDGTIPTTSNGTLIAASSGAVVVTSTVQGTILKAVAFKTGWITSSVRSSAAYLMPQVADPVISPDGGTYPSTPPTSVTISTATSGANIRYTLDGTIPTESNGTLIAASSGTVAVTSTVQGIVLKAIAFKTGCITSAVKSSAAYFMPQVADPVISPNGGTYPSTPPTTVTIATATSGANIRYTLDGTIPSASNGTLIAASSGTVAVTSTAQGTVLKVVGFKTGWITSAVKSSVPYSMPQVATPAISPDGGTYPSTAPTTVTITTTTSGANIRYTLDGTVPTESNGTLIAASSGTVAVTSTAQGAVLKAIAIKTGWIPSTVKLSAPFAMPQVAEPVFSPGGGPYPSSDPVTVTITTTTSGANIRYTLDGTIPTVSNGTLIAGSSGTVSVTPAGNDLNNTRLRAVAFKSGWSVSAVHLEAYSLGGSGGPCYPVAYPGCDEGPN